MMGPKEAKAPHLRGAKKYDEKTRKLVRRRIKQLRREGKNAEHTAEILNAEGFKTPNGKACDKLFVANQLAHINAAHNKGRVSKPRRKVIREPRAVRVLDAATMKPVGSKPASTLPTSIELMLSDSQLTAAQKVELILAYQRSL